MLEETNLEIPSLEYLAGLFDGEGSIFITSTTNKYGKHHLYLRVGINITNKYIPTLYHNRFGGNIGTIPSRGNRKIQWYWRVSGEDADNFIKTIQPYLLIKKYQAQIAIDFYNNKDDYELSLVGKELMGILNRRGL